MQSRSLLKGFIYTFLICLLQQLAFAQNTTEGKHFPRYIWSFWDGEPDIFSKLCLNNMKRYAEKSGWQFTVLNLQSFQALLSEQTKELFQKIVDKGGYKRSKLADLIRCFIVYEKGGMWLDASIILVQQMGWLQNIQNEVTIYNKVSKTPEVICYTYNGLIGGNKTIFYDRNRSQQITIIPGIENWAFVAKQRSKFFTDVLSLFKINALQRNQSEPDIIKSYVDEGYAYQLEADQYFIFGDFHLQTVLQKRQKQIDRNPQKFGTKYAVDYYQMWLIRGQQTTMYYEWFIERLQYTKYFKLLFYSYDKEEAQKMKFIKIHAKSRQMLDSIIMFAPYLMCLNLIPNFIKESFIYKELLETDSTDTQIIEFKRLFQQPNKVCQQKSLFLIFSIIVIVCIFIVIIYLIKYGINVLLDQRQEIQYRNISSLQQEQTVSE